MKVLALLVSLLALPAVVSAQTSGSSLANPEWLATPSGEDVDRYYPKAMQRKGMHGESLLECQVGQAGELAVCAVLFETPEDMGLTDATLKMSKLFRMSRTTGDGTATAGGYVRIPMTWRVNAQPRPPSRGARMGYPAYTLSADLGAQAAIRMPCPTKEKPKQLCELQEFAWIQKPTQETSAASVSQLSDVPGLMRAACTIADDGRIGRCVYSETLSPPQTEAMTSLLGHYLAPETSAQGTQIRGRQIITYFDFESLAKIAANSAAFRRQTGSPPQ